MLIKVEYQGHVMIGQVSINNVYDFLSIKNHLYDGVYTDIPIKIGKNEKWEISMPSKEEKEQWATEMKKHMDVVESDTNIQIDLLKIS